VSNPKGEADAGNHVARLPKTIGEHQLWRIAEAVRSILLLTDTLNEGESAPLLEELERLLELARACDQEADRDFILAMRIYVMAQAGKGYKPEWSKGLSTNGLN
tara:strand:- start:3 stop:314 length:312 start_codon:yes stop_codon:yes gene_type:complete